MRSTCRLLSFITVILSICVSTTWAQNVFWSPSGGTFQEGKGNSLDLVFDGCEPAGELAPPDVDGLSLTFRGTSSSTNIVNGRVTRKVIYSYQAVPNRRGSIEIPSFTVDTDKGDVQVPQARYTVVEATVGSSGAKPEDVFLSRFQLRDGEIYAGEVFELDYYAGAKQDYQLVDLSPPEWETKGLVTNGLKEVQAGSLDLEGQRYTAKAYKARAMATESGILELPGTKQEATIVVGRRRDFLFQEPVYDSFAIESEPFSLEILPLPDNAPPNFSGAVGDFELESRVVPDQVQVGEPVTWTLKLSGEGNWPEGISVPQRTVSNKFRAIQPEIKTEFEQGDLFKGSQSEDIVLIPTEEGVFNFGPLSFSYFDPKQGEYKTIEIPSQRITVSPAAGSPAQPSAPSPAGDAASTFAPPSGAETYDFNLAGENTAKRAPELPQEPLASKTTLPAPRAHLSLLPYTLAAILAPLGVWFILAMIRSVVDDPLRPRRQALRRWRKLTDEATAKGGDALIELQRPWRQALAGYLGLQNTEPSAEEVRLAALQAGNDEFAREFQSLWTLSDQLLYGAKKTSSSDWAALAKRLANAAKCPRYRLGQLFTRQAWMGAAAALCLLLAPATELRADQGADAYESGDFATAEQAWVSSINAEPYVFEHRYNAGLAAAQQQDWGRAWAYWVGAFCLNPHEPRLEWNLKLAHGHTDAYDPVLQSLLEKDGIHRVIRMLSPAGWQRLAIGSLWFAGGFLTLAILTLHLTPSRRSSFLLFLAFALSGTNAYFSKWASSEYGSLSDTDALLVTASVPLNSIPSELDAEQISSAISAGTILRPTRDFLGWLKVTLPNGDIGWIRRENVMPLYGPIDSAPSEQ
ncbi:BatD family protein [Pelagicoccus sp. SDUM812003]|uniref:BatD family protein n=1 Tax=Pelagicoccus sp. SDUM812003 TaxID=3041267 RepID=UPI00280CA6BB|nr:BatD family protein [Pelagicoccus sp. SDUM812003]MDQ8203081.1 BatD family protein [Pelagicoccus sp. SDUM812003]